MPNNFKIGMKETGEIWRDNYITPPWLIDQINLFYDCVWFDPCPVNSAWDIFQYPDIDRAYRLYVNPPFSQYKRWTNHFLGKTDEQIWLCNTNNSSSWYQDLLAHATVLCLLERRIIFIDPRTGEKAENSSYGKSQSIIYTGKNPERFVAIFSKFGKCLTPWR